MYRHVLNYCFRQHSIGCGPLLNGHLLHHCTRPRPIVSLLLIYPFILTSSMKWEAQIIQKPYLSPNLWLDITKIMPFHIEVLLSSLWEVPAAEQRWGRQRSSISATGGQHFWARGSRREQPQPGKLLTTHQPLGKSHAGPRRGAARWADLGEHLGYRHSGVK